MSDIISSLPSWYALDPDPADDGLKALTAALGELDGPADEAGGWPDALWSVLANAKVPLWSIPAGLGGDGVERIRLLTRYARIAEGSLTAAFILSQHDAAVRRLAAASERPVATWWLDAIRIGMAFTTVGISHLTTSRRAGDRALKATSIAGSDDFQLDGVMPWVTAAEKADVFVAGASLDDGRQILVALPADRPGVRVEPAFPLAALQASRTAEVCCEGVRLHRDDILDGPAPNVIAHPGAAGTGGLETSALALGLARAALNALEAERPRRADLSEPVDALAGQWRAAWQAMLDAAQGTPGAPAPGAVRSQANAIVLRATQAFLTARKGTGFLRPDPAQRWARAALFFLVWSCPSPVAAATIRDLAGVCSP